MKKILLATTLLAGFAGAASAEVTISGEARMGVEDLGGPEGVQFIQRVRVKFAMEGETDGGLAFGAEMRADQDGGNADDTANGDSIVYIPGAFGKLSMGDVGSAADNVVGNVSGVGVAGLTDWNELGYIGNDKTAAKYEYTSGAFTAAISSGQLDSTGGSLDTASVAVKYSGEAFSVALGYEDVTGADQLTLGASATFGAVTAKVVLADNSLDADTRGALSIDYVAGATTFTGFYSTNKAGLGVDAIGLGAAYDLGGGASVKGGIVDLDVPGSDLMFDLGVAMTF
jgi:outer membrane protein OmpU